MSQEQLTQLRHAAREIFDRALRAVDAREVTRRAVFVEGDRVRVGNTELRPDKPVYVLSIGKAAAPMAQALNEAIGNRISGGIVTCPIACEGLPAQWRQFASGHPLPNAESLNAAQSAFQLLDMANAEEAVVLFAVSGGGSAMIEWPAAGDISLTDLQEANRLLVQCGATIAEINTVRRAFSAVKGGKLANRAGKAQVATLIISDTNRGDEASVASGPSLSPPPSATTASEIVERFGLTSKLPPSILRTVQHSTEFSLSLQASGAHVLADNRTAIDAASEHARLLGYVPVVADDILEQPIAEGCELLIDRLAAEPSPACLISGGEFACTVRGQGHGGRNLETALRCAVDLDRRNALAHTVILSAGTDGIDGNSLAAGAIVDETTITRAHSLRLDPSDFLNRSDSYSFLQQLGDTILTGPTATNVRDLRICLKTN